MPNIDLSHRAMSSAIWYMVLIKREVLDYFFQMQRLTDPFRYMSFQKLSLEVKHEVVQRTHGAIITSLLHQNDVVFT